MSSNDFISDKKLKKIDRQLSEIISRTGLDRKTQDEVFDKTTLLTFDKLISDKIIDYLDFPISTGKEGNVFRGVTKDKRFVAVKIYRTNTSTFKHILQYIDGDPRFQSIRKTRRDIVYAWTQKEYKNLERAHRINLNVPKPIKFIKNVLVLEYIGDKNTPAPLMKDVTLSNPKKTFDEIIKIMGKLYKKADLVHGDMSAFNFLYFKNKIYLIDLGQAVLLDHPNSDEFLRRDIKNILTYFKKYKINKDENKIYKLITA